MYLITVRLIQFMSISINLLSIWQFLFLVVYRLVRVIKVFLSVNCQKLRQFCDLFRFDEIVFLLYLVRHSVLYLLKLGSKKGKYCGLYTDVNILRDNNVNFYKTIITVNRNFFECYITIFR